MEDDINTAHRIRYRIKRRPGRKRRQAGVPRILLSTVLALVAVAALYSFMDPAFPERLDSCLSNVVAVAGYDKEVSICSSIFAFLSGVKDKCADEAVKVFGKYFSSPEVETSEASGDRVLLSPALFSCAALLPVKNGSITDGFACRSHPLTGKLDIHTGLDIAAEAGTPVLAAWPGTIRESGVSEIYGKYVVMEHSGNIKTFYGHCSQVCASVGSVIRQGETIALVGSTGLSTGPHLHFEVIVDGLRVNPAFAL